MGFFCSVVPLWKPYPPYFNAVVLIKLKPIFYAIFVLADHEPSFGHFYLHLSGTQNQLFILTDWTIWNILKQALILPMMWIFFFAQFLAHIFLNVSCVVFLMIFEFDELWWVNWTEHLQDCSCVTTIVQFLPVLSLRMWCYTSRNCKSLRERDHSVAYWLNTVHIIQTENVKSRTVFVWFNLLCLMLILIFYIFKS